MAAALVLLVLATPVTGEELDRPLRAFFEPLDVPLVNVEVFVADAKGQPVPGLTVDDFEVREDGERVEISHFYASPDVAASSDAGDLADTETIDRPSQQLFLVIFVDDTNLSPQRRKRAFDHLGTMIDASMPEDLRVMIATYDGDLHVRQDFVPVSEALSQTLAEVARETSFSRRMESERLLRDMQSTAAANAAAAAAGGDGRFAENDPDEALRAIETYAKSTRDRARRGLDVMERFVRSLSGLPGRKAFLVVCDGIEVRPGEFLFEAWHSIFGQGGGGNSSRAFLAASRFDLGSELEQLTRFANAHRVSFYVLSTLGDRQVAMMSAEGRSTIGPGAGVNAMLTEEQALNALSGGTGGRVLVNSPALGAQLEEVSRELGSYYSLGYRPDHVGDGKYHRIKVKVSREGISVRHREGYLDSGQSDRTADRTLAAAVLGVTENPLGISVDCQEIEPRDDGTFLVPVLIKVPLGQLVLLPQEGQHEGRVTILLAVQAADGGLSDLQRRVYPIQVPNEQFLTAVDQEAGFVMGLAMRAGPQRIAVGVRDDLAKLDSTVTLDVNVGGQG